MNDVVIVAATRTAAGKFGGSLAKISAADLGAHVIKGLIIAKTGIKPDQVSEVIIGQVLTAGNGLSMLRGRSLRHRRQHRHQRRAAHALIRKRRLKESANTNLETH